MLHFELFFNNCHVVRTTDLVAEKYYIFLKPSNAVVG